MTQGSSRGGSPARLSPSLFSGGFRNWRGRIQPLPPGEIVGAGITLSSPPRTVLLAPLPGQLGLGSVRGSRVRLKRRSPPGSVGRATQLVRNGRGQRPAETGEVRDAGNRARAASRNLSPPGRPGLGASVRGRAGTRGPAWRAARRPRRGSRAPETQSQLRKGGAGRGAPGPGRPLPSRASAAELGRAGLGGVLELRRPAGTLTLGPGPDRDRPQPISAPELPDPLS